MSSGSLRRGDWIALLAALGGVSLVALLVVLPQHKAIREAEAEIATNELVIEHDALVQAQFAVAERDLATARAYVAGWKERSAGGRALPALFGRIAQLAESCGATVSRFEPQAPIALEQLQRVPLKMECQGAFEAVFAMLRELESLPREIWVEDLEIARTDEDGQTVHCALSLAIFADRTEISD